MVATQVPQNIFTCLMLDMEHLNCIQIRTFGITWRVMSVQDNFHHGYTVSFTQNGHIYLPNRRYGEDKFR